MKMPRDKVKDKDKGKDDIEREFVWKDGKEVSAALSPDGKTVAAAGKDVVCFFDVITGQERRYEHPTNVKPQFLFRTQSIKFSADGSRIALVGGEGKIRILAVADGRRIAEFATKSRRPDRPGLFAGWPDLAHDFIQPTCVRLGGRHRPDGSPAGSRDLPLFTR